MKIELSNNKCQLSEAIVFIGGCIELFIYIYMCVCMCNIVIGIDNYFQNKTNSWWTTISLSMFLKHDYKTTHILTKACIQYNGMLYVLNTKT